jgi:uncharacterized protein (DUF1501 family)
MKNNSRRKFISDAKMLGFGYASLQLFEFQKMLAAEEPKPEISAQISQNTELNSNPLFVTIFLRGACDGLSYVCPRGGEDRVIYESQRPSLKLALEGNNAALPLDERFCLHPSAKDFHNLFQSKELSFVHACGSGYKTRSHFDAQNWMEWGAKLNVGTGWLTRLLEVASLEGPFGVGAHVPQSFLGNQNTVVTNSFDGLYFKGNILSEDFYFNSLKNLYKNSEKNFQKSFESIEKIRNLDNLEISETNVEYPKFELSRKLQIASDYARRWKNLNILQVDMGGWDTHKYQGKGAEGLFAKFMLELSSSVSAFYNDLKQHRKNLNIVIISEFGRRLKENANGGTDHGHGSVMTLIGNQIQGGNVFGNWPGLKTDALFERADLATTTNFQSVLSEILKQQFNVKNFDKIFLDAPKIFKYIGIIK